MATPGFYLAWGSVTNLKKIRQSLTYTLTFQPRLFSPLCRMCSCSCSFSFSRLLFLIAPSLKCLVPKITCHRRSRVRLSSPVCCSFMQTQTTCWANETPQMATKILLHLWEYLSPPWHTRTSLLKWTLNWQSSSNTLLPNVSPCRDISGSQSDIISNMFLACSSRDSKFSMFSRAFLSAGLRQFCQN